MLDDNLVLEMKDIGDVPAIYIVLISSPELEPLGRVTHG